MIYDKKKEMLNASKILLIWIFGKKKKTVLNQFKIRKQNTMRKKIMKL